MTFQLDETPQTNTLLTMNQICRKLVILTVGHMRNDRSHDDPLPFRGISGLLRGQMNIGMQTEELAMTLEDFTKTKRLDMYARAFAGAANGMIEGNPNLRFVILPHELPGTQTAVVYLDGVSIRFLWSYDGRHDTSHWFLDMAMGEPQ